MINFKFILTFLMLLCMSKEALAEKLPLPRFATIKSAKMNSRVGPGFDYPVIWHYWRKNMPVEIIEEYDQWRKIKDVDGDTSWVYQSLLSGVRSAIIKVAQNKNRAFLPILTTKDLKSHIISKVENGAIVTVKHCDKTWCYINIGRISGYVPQEKLWGVYKDEIIK